MDLKNSKQKPQITGESFAEKLRTKPELQVAVYTQPARIFSEEDKLAVIDAIGNTLAELPEEIPMPKFLATNKRENYLIITTEDEASRSWLLKTIPLISIWNEHRLCSMLAQDIPKLSKGLLWLPGKQKLPNEEILRRIKKQNPRLHTDKWKVLKRHEEPLGTRLFIGVEDRSLREISESGNKPQWSTCRAQFTSLEDMIKRRQTRKASKANARQAADRKATPKAAVQLKDNRDSQNATTAVTPRPRADSEVTDPKVSGVAASNKDAPATNPIVMDLPEMQAAENPKSADHEIVSASQEACVVEVASNSGENVTPKAGSNKRKPEDFSPKSDADSPLSDGTDCQQSNKVWPKPFLASSRSRKVQGVQKATRSVKKKKLVSDADGKITNFLVRERSHSLPPRARKTPQDNVNPSSTGDTPCISDFTAESSNPINQL